MLERIDRINSDINAIYFVDYEGALDSARASESRWASGTPLGPFDGIPTTSKDALALRGMPMHRGSASSPVEIASSDHPTMARLKEAGAILLGKNTMCDYGIISAGVSSQYGPTRNPWKLDATTGASSSGAAATLAAGIGPISVGTDIVGSIRLPASYCGLVGLKPTQGKVPYYFPNDPALTAGPMARNVFDAALFLNLLSQADSRDFTALRSLERDHTIGLDNFQPKKNRALFIPSIGFGLKLDSEVEEACSRAINELRTEGLKIDQMDGQPFEPRDDQSAAHYYKIRCLTEFRKQSSSAQEKSLTILEWTKPGLKMTAVELYDAMNDLKRLTERVVSLIDGYDFLLLPSTPIAAHDATMSAPEGEDLFAPWCNTFLFNLTGQPALSINCGFTEDGRPIGLQIVASRNADFEVLQLAKFYETIRAAEMTWPII